MVTMIFFIAKFSGDLTEYLGFITLRGSFHERSIRVVLDSSGNVYAVGYTDSPDFPTTPGAYKRNFHGRSEAFICKLDRNLKQLLASTFIGGEGEDWGLGIAFDSKGNVYVTGMTTSIFYPTTPGSYNRAYNGGYSDVFVSKLSGDLSQLLVSTFIGGLGGERANSIAIDSAGNVYVTGGTSSYDFPTSLRAFDRYFNGKSDIFVSKLSGDLSQLLASTFIGGRDREEIPSIALDNSGNVYITGRTASSDYPTTAFAYDTNNNWVDVFISKLDSNLSAGFPVTYTLTITKSGTGNGTVTSSPLGISCGSDCSEDYLTGTFVTLTTTPNQDSDFRGWGGDCSPCESNSICLIIMDSDKICTAIFNCTPPFTDVPCDHWAIDNISAIKDAGITYGCNPPHNDRFCPEDPVTRAQMATFIIRAIEGEPVSYNPNPYFSDVSPIHWAFKYVQRVKERNIAQGYPGTNLYGPEDAVTREQMAKMLIMALVSQGRISEPPSDYCSTGVPFVDVDVNSWSCRFIKRLKELGITQGCNPPQNDRYCPQDTVTRAQMATFIYRAFLR